MQVRQVVSEVGVQQLDEGAPSEALAHPDVDFDEDNVDKVSSLKTTRQITTIFSSFLTRKE